MPLGNSFSPIRIYRPFRPKITSELDVDATFTKTGFRYQITATNSPSTYSATGLPGFLDINTSTGLIYGDIPLTGTTTTYNITIGATNDTGSDFKVLKLFVEQPPEITSGGFAVGWHQSDSIKLQATNSPTSWLIISGNTNDINAVLTTSGTLTLFGNPTPSNQDVTVQLRIRAYNRAGDGEAFIPCTAFREPPPVVPVTISWAKDPKTGFNIQSVDFAVGQPASYQFIVTGDAPITVTCDDTLPDGLSVSAGGLISGTPTKHTWSAGHFFTALQSHKDPKTDKYYEDQVNLSIGCYIP